MISAQEFRKITVRKYHKMLSRSAPRYYKSGRRKGMVRVPGRPLPFTLEEFREWVMREMGYHARHCFYCPRLIDVLHFEPDHYDPLEHGGSLGLENLRPACEDCNNAKGAMPGDDFTRFMAFARGSLSQAGVDDLFKRLRAGAMGIRLRHFPNARKGTADAYAEPEQPPTPGELDF